MADYRVTGSWQRYQNLPIRALAQGGYERVGIPNPNSGMALFGSGSGITTPNVEQLRRQADDADRYALADVRANEAEELGRFDIDPLNPRGLSGTFREQRELGNQLQGQIRNDPYRLYFQALKNAGVDQLQTAGAAGAKQGGGYDRRQTVDYASQLRGGPQVTGYTEGPNLGGSSPGFFDYNPHNSLAESYQEMGPEATMYQDPAGTKRKNFKGYQARETQAHNLYERNALDQLRNWRLR